MNEVGDMNHYRPANYFYILLLYFFFVRLRWVRLIIFIIFL